MSNSISFTIRALLALATAQLATGTAAGAPFVPLEWQGEIKAGPMVGERKHLDWVRDLDGDFVDDRFSELAPSEMTDALVQLSQCEERANIIAKLSAYGNVKRTGTLVGYAYLQDVPVNMLQTIAMEPGVAAVERPERHQAFLDTSNRAIRAKSSDLFDPETFEAAFPGTDGSGINIAILDSGVDDTVHGAFTGSFVSGYDATTSTVINPDDDWGALKISVGPNGICDTTAVEDDIQKIPVGQTLSNTLCVGVGPDGALASMPGFFSDDFMAFLLCDGTTPVIATGPDGICDTAAAGDDYQILAVGTAATNASCVEAGVNGTIESVPPPASDDLTKAVFHGTHVAGIALGQGVGPGCRLADDGSAPNDCRGVASGAGLVDIKVLDSTGGSVGDSVEEGVERVWLDGNARVVNMSVGNNAMSDGTEVVSQLVNGLVANDISVAVAAGNSSANCIGTVASSSFAVTAASSNDASSVDRTDDTFSDFSTFGPRVDFNPLNVFIGMLKPDVAAPGTDIFSALGNSAASYHSLSGTSMASPHVAGAMALLLDLEPAAPPGAIKDVLKRTAFQTPQHAAAGASFPGTDGVYNVNWGFGEIDLWQAATQLQAGVADLSFTDCIGPNPAFPDSRRCTLSGGKASYANNVDIQVATDPPVKGQPNTITVNVENRSSSAADSVTVCVGVKEFGVGPVEFYDVGCREINMLGGLGTTSVSIPWTPTDETHQCIQASIDYGFDTDFANNLTQRNIDTINSSSPSKLEFRVENPLNEPARIELAASEIAGAFNLLRVVPGNPPLTPPFFYRQVRGQEIFREVQLGPENCPVIQGDLVAIPMPGAPIGATGRISISGTAFSKRFPEGFPLSGVTFNLVVAAAGLQRASSIASHGSEGEIEHALNLAGVPQSDGRREIRKLLAVFNVPVRSAQDRLPSAASVRITSQRGNPIPDHTVTMLDRGVFPVEGVIAGRELLIEFARPLSDQDRYTFEFGIRGTGASLVDVDGDALLGDTNVDLRVVQGDANGSGAVTGTDVSFVRGRIGVPVAFGGTAQADVNLTGTLTATDISFVRGRIGGSSACGLGFELALVLSPIAWWHRRRQHKELCSRG